jgi:hypothetical protein
LDWSLSNVDLRGVLSFQKKVILEGVDQRVAAVRVDDLRSLFELCLPAPDQPRPMSASVDQDLKGVALSSLNPNLRAIGYHAQDAQVSPAPGQPAQRAKLVGFVISFGAPFLQVVEYRDRWFIRDGYHRAYALLRAGILQVPCVLVRARSFAETGAEAQAFFRHEILYGDRPPFLPDFLDNSVSTSATEPVTRKVIRLRADEFFTEA